MTFLDAAHLDPRSLAAVQRHLVTKALSEFAHERLLAPVPTGPVWTLHSPDGRACYSFAAERLPLDHWAIDPDTVTRTVDGEPAELDVQELVVELAPLLGIPDASCPSTWRSSPPPSSPPRGSGRLPSRPSTTWSSPTTRRSRPR